MAFLLQRCNCILRCLPMQLPNTGATSFVKLKLTSFEFSWKRSGWAVTATCSRSFTGQRLRSYVKPSTRSNAWLNFLHLKHNNKDRQKPQLSDWWQLSTKSVHVCNQPSQWDHQKIQNAHRPRDSCPVRDLQLLFYGLCPGDEPRLTKPTECERICKAAKAKSLHIWAIHQRRMFCQERLIVSLSFSLLFKTWKRIFGKRAWTKENPKDDLLSSRLIAWKDENTKRSPGGIGRWRDKKTPQIQLVTT